MWVRLPRTAELGTCASVMTIFIATTSNGHPDDTDFGADASTSVMSDSDTSNANAPSHENGSVAFAASTIRTRPVAEKEMPLFDGTVIP